MIANAPNDRPVKSPSRCKKALKTKAESRQAGQPAFTAAHSSAEIAVGMHRRNMQRYPSVENRENAQIARN
ncbi:hypothetical protein [Taklimakanibacter lacteus]|uniref:hypothetical protein n=1 Tax=Taklimakanibacter lacteus TaxID=2268456 RepID=UPI000E663E76